jgi:hypothetical protein
MLAVHRLGIPRTRKLRKGMWTWQSIHATFEETIAVDDEVAIAKKFKLERTAPRTRAIVTPGMRYPLGICRGIQLVSPGGPAVY